MSFCVKCGNKIDDGAAFCSVCGAKVEAPAPVEAPVEAPAQTAAPAPEKAKKGGLFTFIGDLLAIVSAFFYGASLASAYIDVNVYISKYSSSGIKAYGYLEPGDAGGIIGFILSLGAIAMGVIGLIVALKNRSGKEALFAAIKKLTLGTFLAILGIVFMANM